MLKKILIGVLLITVMGAAGAALAYNAVNKDVTVSDSGPNPLSMGQTSNSSKKLNAPQSVDTSQGSPVAQGTQGEPWEGVGTVSNLDDYGFEITTTNGETAYVELGPPDYWQAQEIELSEDQLVMVSGSINEEGVVHATSVTLSDGGVLALREASGQPLWSGGAGNSRGQNGQAGDGNYIPDSKAQVDEWIILEGTLVSFQGGSMTMSTSDGALINFQTGQPRFFADQGITFQVGNQISVLGFYEGQQFMAGEITQLETGLRVMLRDPNGRPLWAGPGNGNGGSGNGGNGHGNGGS
jgi:hypothetical protein